MAPSRSPLMDRQVQLQEEVRDAQDALSILEHEPGSPEPLETESNVAVLRARVGALMNHVVQLEELRDSEWARGLTDEPPPSYITGVGRH